MLRCLALAHPFRTRQTNPQVKFHGVNPSSLLAAIAKGKKWTTFTPPAAALRRRYHGLILHRRSHINGQRITKDHWLVVKLCHDCHQTGKVSVHGLGGEAKFLEVTGWDLVAIAVLNRHNFEMRAR